MNPANINVNAKDELITIHFVHGIHATRKPATSQLAPYVKEYFAERGIKVEIKVHSYGYALALPRFFTGDWLNNRHAKKIAEKVKDGDIMLGHSNGTTINYLVQRDHRKLLALVLFQAALDNDVSFAGTNQVLVIYNEKDDVVEQSRWARFNSWGNMGRVGYKGPGQNVVQWDSMNPPNVPPLPYAEHCGFVDNGPEVLESWARAVAVWMEPIVIAEYARRTA